MFHKLAHCPWRAVISIEFEKFKGRQLVDARTSGRLAVDIRNSTFYHSHVLAISLFREIPSFCTAIKRICNGLPAFIADGVTVYRVYDLSVLELFVRKIYCLNRRLTFIDALLFIETLRLVFACVSLQFYINKR